MQQKIDEIQIWMEKKAAVLYAQAVAEALLPVHPGVPGKVPFWNGSAMQFMYAPAFDFKPVAGAVRYRFTARSMANQKDFVFEADTPVAALIPVWKELPVGKVELKVEGLDGKNEPAGVSGTRAFWRAAVYNGPYHKAVMDYEESARRGLAWLSKHEFAELFKKGIPAEKDPMKYGLRYCGKWIEAVIRAMLLYADVLRGTKEAKDALVTACNAADYLIGISEPPGSILAYFAPIYAKEEGHEKRVNILVRENAAWAMSYLNLYDVTKARRFLDAATRIADTYAKTQLPSGTWPRMINTETGRPTTVNLCIPSNIVNYLDRLESQYGLGKYRQTREAALRWLMDNPVKTCNWEGEFDDVGAGGAPYTNQTEFGPVELAEYMGRHIQDHPGYREQIRELLRFAEDQFVVWEQPQPSTWAGEGVIKRKWLTPCVLEQYRCYTPVGGSADAMVDAYQRAYEALGDELYLAKAVALANSITVAQDPDSGIYPTWWFVPGVKDDDLWYNAGVRDAEIMLSFARFMKSNTLPS